MRQHELNYGADAQRLDVSQEESAAAAAAAAAVAAGAAAAAAAAGATNDDRLCLCLLLRNKTALALWQQLLLARRRRHGTAAQHVERPSAALADLVAKEHGLAAPAQRLRRGRTAVAAKETATTKGTTGRRTQMKVAGVGKKDFA